MDSTWRVLTGILPSPISSMGARGAPGASLNVSYARPTQHRSTPGPLSCSTQLPTAPYQTARSRHGTVLPRQTSATAQHGPAQPVQHSSAPPRRRKSTEPASTCTPPAALQPSHSCECSGQVALPAAGPRTRTAQTPRQQ